MKEIFLIYTENCIASRKSILMLEKLVKEKKNIIIHKIPFSFQEPLVKRYMIMITPTFIIGEKVVFTGTPSKKELIKELAA